MTEAENLAAMDRAATQGVWTNDPGFQSRSYIRTSGGDLIASFSHIAQQKSLPAIANTSFVAGLVNLYRANKLAVIDEGAVERVARALHSIEESWNDIEWEYLPENVQATFCRQATAAIAALTGRE